MCIILASSSSIMRVYLVMIVCICDRGAREQWIHVSNYTRKQWIEKELQQQQQNQKTSLPNISSSDFFVSFDSLPRITLETNTIRYGSEYKQTHFSLQVTRLFINTVATS